MSTARLLGTRFSGLSLGLDGPFTSLPSNGSTSTKSVRVGPRAVVHIPVVPLRVFGEVLIGGAHTTTGQGNRLTTMVAAWKRRGTSASMRRSFRISTGSGG